MDKFVDSYEWDEICRRAGGRRRYNARRKLIAEMRRFKVAQLVKEYGLYERGVQKRIADELGVSEATISRDIALLCKLARPQLLKIYASRDRLRKSF